MVSRETNPSMSRRYRYLASISLFLLCVTTTPRSAPAGDDWQPIAPEDLALKDNPASPGAHAMILYRESMVDAVQSSVSEYVRIKIFTEQGRKEANVEIPFVKGFDDIQDVRARTIRPDGTVVNYEGKPFEKMVVKVSGYKVLAKTFTLPDVQPGCIIEYRYRDQSDPRVYYSEQWKVYGNLFTRLARFSIKPDKRSGSPVLMYRHYGLPPGATPQPQKDGSYTLELHDLHGIEEEPYMPPERALQGTVDFYYLRHGDLSNETTESYWNRIGSEWGEQVDHFVSKKGALERELSQTVAPSDSPEVKLQKIYARLQKIRNLGDEETKTKKEEKKESLKENNNAEDLLKHGYGWPREINWLFIGLVRTAGFEAAEIYVAPRNTNLFMPEMKDTKELTSDVVWVHAGNLEYHLDPGAAFYPFGLLPWWKTATKGVLSLRTGGKIVETPVQGSSLATIARKGTLKVSDDGTVSGTLEVEFTGQQGAVEREDGQDKDDAGRRKARTDEIQGWLPGGATFEITKLSDWKQVAEPLRVEGELKAPGIATPAGRRLLMPVTIFESGETKAFQTARRVNIVYFHYPYQEIDDLKFEGPPGYKIETLPIEQKPVQSSLTYQMTATQDGNDVEVKRQLDVKAILIPVEAYPALRSFFTRVKNNDDAQIIFQSSKSASNN